MKMLGGILLVSCMTSLCMFSSANNKHGSPADTPGDGPKIVVIKDTEDKVELQIKDSDGNVLVTIDRFPLMGIEIERMTDRPTVCQVKSLEENGPCFNEERASVGELPKAVIELCEGKEFVVMKERPCPAAPGDNGEGPPDADSTGNSGKRKKRDVAPYSQCCRYHRTYTSTCIEKKCCVFGWCLVKLCCKTYSYTPVWSSQCITGYEWQF